MLDHTDDVATQNQKLAEANNLGIRLTDELIAIGTQLNLADVDMERAITIEEKRDKRIIWKTIKGKYKEKQARIKQLDRQIAIIKYFIKAERNQF